MLIDVYLSTCRRPALLEQTLAALLTACQASAQQHRITVLADGLDPATTAVLSPYLTRCALLSSPEIVGLPLMFNLMLEHSTLIAARSERAADHICYIQDDCLIEHPDDFFAVLLDARRHLPRRRAGYVSGFYCPLHPGFAIERDSRYSVVHSDSIDGKQFLAPFAMIHKVGPISWRDKKKRRRGNPGPEIGSGVDLWQWRDSPCSLKRQRRTSLIIPGLCSHLAQRSEQSTWSNRTTPAHVAERIERQQWYDTRGTPPQLDEADWYQPTSR